MPSEEIIKERSKAVPVHRIAFIVSSLFAGLYFLSAAGVFKGVLWSLSIDTYLPKPFLIAQLAACILVLASFFIVRNDWKINLPARSLYIIFGAIFLTMCLLLQESIPLYGDGFLHKNNIEIYTPVRFSEILSLFVYRAVYLILPATLKSGEMAYRIVNTLVAILAVVGYIKISRDEDVSMRPYLILIFLTLGINVLFFGHVENYTLCFVATMFYLILLTGPTPRVELLSIMLGLSISLHIVSLALIPSFVYYIVKEKREIIGPKLLTKVAVLCLLPIAMSILLGIILGHPAKHLLKNILTTSFELREYSTGAYLKSILNLNHWLDIINIIFLNLITWPVFVVLLLIGGDKKQIFRERFIKYLVLGAVPFFLFLILFDSHLGLARDWDIGSIGVIYTIMLGIILTVRLLTSLPDGRSIIGPIALLTFVLAAPWLVVNRLPEPSLTRYKEILATQPELKGTAWGYEILALYHRDRKEVALSAYNYELAGQHFPENWRHWYNAAVAYIEDNNIERAIVNLRVARRFNFDEPDIFSNLGYAFFLAGMNDSALVAYKRAFVLDSLDVNHLHNLGRAYHLNGFYNESIEMFNRVLKIEPMRYNSSIGLVDALIAVKRLTEAKMILEDLTSIYGQNADILNRWQKLKGVANGNSGH